MGLGIYALALSGGGSRPFDGRLRAALLLLSGCALATTHELSPFIVGGVVLVLTLFGYVRPRWAAAAVLVPATIWAGVNYDVLSGFVSFSFLLHLSNFSPPRTVAAPGLARQLIVAGQLLCAAARAARADRCGAGRPSAPLARALGLGVRACAGRRPDLRGREPLRQRRHLSCRLVRHPLARAPRRAGLRRPPAAARHRRPCRGVVPALRHLPAEHVRPGCRERHTSGRPGRAAHVRAPGAGPGRVPARAGLRRLSQYPCRPCR